MRMRSSGQLMASTGSSIFGETTPHVTSTAGESLRINATRRFTPIALEIWWRAAPHIARPAAGSGEPRRASRAIPINSTDRLNAAPSIQTASATSDTRPTTDGRTGPAGSTDERATEAGDAFSMAVRGVGGAEAAAV